MSVRGGVVTADRPSRRVAIVDYGLGNLFSVEQACQAVGLSASITPDRRAIEQADAVILPGVGAFGDAMATLRRLDLVGVLRDVAGSGRPFIGICLGVQLLMDESCEFGRHEGLALIPGEVVPLGHPREGDRRLKVPQVGWNRIHPARGSAGDWAATPLAGLADGEFMYFVHSYIVVPDDASVVVSTTRYGDVDFCSSLQSGNVFACQFHPERSGRRGLQVYANLHKMVHMNEARARNSE
jgi:imidazole glycerol-phosphate synthase subunit HisH